MVSNLFSDLDTAEYLMVFYSINRKCDGNLTRAEFLEAFWKVGLKSMSEIELDRILSYVDNDQNGFITFGEFIVASVSQQQILTGDRMRDCFKSFDLDGSGAISKKEIKEIIGKQVRLPESQWSKLMQTDNNFGDLDEEARKAEEERELDEEDFK